MVMGCVRNGTTLERNPYGYHHNGCVFLCPFRGVTGNPNSPSTIHTNPHKSATCGFGNAPSDNSTLFGIAQ